LKFDQWDDKNTGQKRSKLGVVLEMFQFLDSGNRGGGDGGDSGSSTGPASGGSSGRVSQSAPPPSDDADALPSEDDVPF
jgi:single-strand DNA-binding protein